MYADLFTVNRQQVAELCNLILESGLKVKWTCNSRVDYVDEEMLKLMGQAGCWYISWGIESANELILKRIRKGYHKEQAFKALKWSKAAGINNWGYFIIGLPGETEEPIQETIAYAKELPLDIALFHIAAPYPACHSSMKWWKTAGSAPVPIGRKWIWISRRCWTTPICTWSGWNTGRNAPRVSGRCDPAPCSPSSRA